MATYPATASTSNGFTSPLSAPKVDDFQIVYHADIFILALGFCFVLVSLPRAVARIYAVDWRKGHLLGSIVPANATTRTHQVALTRSDTNVSELEKVDPSDDSHYSHSPPEDLKKDISIQNSPPHVPAFSTFLHPVSSILRYRVASGLSYGQALILAIYSAILGYLSLYRTNLILDPARCAWNPLIEILALIHKTLQGWKGCDVTNSFRLRIWHEE